MRHAIDLCAGTMLTQTQRRPSGICGRLPNTRRRLAQAARSSRLQVDSKFVLKPIGDGTTDHIGGRAAPPIAEYTLKEGVCEIGREPPVDIVIPVPTVSGRHALLRITENSVTVTDLESTNGTYVNRVELKPMEAESLKVGNEVIFGDEHLANFVLLDEPVEDIVVVEGQVSEE